MPLPENPLFDPSLPPSEEPLCLALGAAAYGIGRVIKALTGQEVDSEANRILAVFGVGCFLNMGGADLSAGDHDTIKRLLAEHIAEFEPSDTMN